MPEDDTGEGERGGERTAPDDHGLAERVACAHCGSTDTRPISLFGTGEMTMQYMCRSCHATFERVKWR